MRPIIVQDINAKHTPKLSKSLIALFATAQLLFGFNFGFVKQMKRFQTAARCISVAMGFFMIAYLGFVSYLELTWLIYFVQYLLAFIVLVNLKYPLYDFITDVKSLNKMYLAGKPDHIGILTWVYALVMFCVKLAIGIVYNMSREVYSPLFKVRYPVLIPMLALDCIPISNFLAFYYVYDLMKNLKMDYHNRKCMLPHVRNTYVAVADLFDRVRATNDKLVEQLVFLSSAMHQTGKQAFVQDINIKYSLKLSQSLIALFATAQLLFGFNFGFVKQMKRFQTAARCMSITMGVLMIAYLGAVSYFELTWIVFFVQYLCAFIILVNLKYPLNDFIMDVKSLDRMYLAEKDDRIGILTWVYALVMFCVQLAIGIVYNMNIGLQGSLFKVRYPVLIPMLALDCIPISNFLSFYYVYDIMRDLKIDFRNGKCELPHVRNTYVAVADLFDKIRATNNKLMVLGFVTDSPKWILTIWSQLVLQKTSESWLALGCGYAYGLHLTIQICVPAIVAEMVHAQTDAITMIIHERLLSETDEASTAELLQLLRYMKARRLLRCAWRLLPVDLRLPVTMLSMCTTYLIVIIQFTHLYD